jgi:hypothetical protein
MSIVGSCKEMGERSCTYAPLDAGDAETSLKKCYLERRAWLKINALGSMLGDLGDGKEDVLQDQKLGGFIFNKSSDAIFPYPTDSNTIYSYISHVTDNAMIGLGETDTSNVDTKPRSPFPCVYEVPHSCARHFCDADAKVVSQNM